VRLSLIVAVLLVLNILLLGANALLLRSLERLAGAKRPPGVDMAAVRAACDRLAAERARLEDRCDRLERLLFSVQRKSLKEKAGKKKDGVSAAQEDPFDPNEAFAQVALVGGLGRPDPLQIPVMTEDELQLLRAKRKAMPLELTDGALLQGDLDSLLENRLWNPNGRALSSAERLALAKLVSEYRYFRKISPIERFRKGIRPQIERLREAGAFIEYPQDQGPPLLEGLRVSYSEPSERPGYRRLYCFWPEDYPELNHQEQIEGERSLERFVQIYELINGPLVPAEPGPPQAGDS